MHATKAYKRSGGIALLILNLSSRREWLASRLSRFTCGELIRCPLDRSKGGPGTRSESSGDEKSLLSTGYLSKAEAGLPNW